MLLLRMEIRLRPSLEGKLHICKSDVWICMKANEVVLQPAHFPRNCLPYYGIENALLMFTLSMLESAWEAGGKEFKFRADVLEIGVKSGSKGGHEAIDCNGHETELTLPDSIFTSLQLIPSEEGNTLEDGRSWHEKMDCTASNPWRFALQISLGLGRSSDFSSIHISVLPSAAALALCAIAVTFWYAGTMPGILAALPEPYRSCKSRGA